MPGKLHTQSLPDTRLDGLIEHLRRYSEQGLPERLQEAEKPYPPLCAFVRLDVGGIQSFIFRVARPEAEDTSGVARRLRGRSFSVALLSQAIADWFVRLCEVTPANVLFCGGE